MLRQVLLRVKPDALAILALQHFLNDEAIYFYNAPQIDDVGAILSQWADDRANDHMTVLRLRRLTEVQA